MTTGHKRKAESARNLHGHLFFIVVTINDNSARRLSPFHFYREIFFQRDTKLRIISEWKLYSRF